MTTLIPPDADAVPLPDPDVRCGEYAGPPGEGADESLWNDDSMRTYGDAREAKGREDERARLAAQAPDLPTVNFDPQTIAVQICRDVAELGDRNSPPEQPDMMLVTAEELFGIAIGAFADNAAAPVLTASTEPEGGAVSPTAGMTIAQRILHVGGRNNAAGYVEFGSTQAVEALVRQVIRDMPKSDADKLRSALNCMLTFFGMDEEEHSKEVFDQARAALAGGKA